MTISFEIPPDIARNLQAQLGDLSRAAKELLLLDSFRQGTLSHHELSQALGLDRLETDAILKKHNIFEGSLTFEDLEQQRETLDRVLGPVLRL